MQKQVDISQKDWDKIINYSKLAYEEYKSEIAGMLLLVETKEGMLLKDPVILKQEVTAGNCWLDKDALAKYYSEMAVKHGPNNIKFVWWHSHHTMSAFWSSTDEEAMKEFSSGDWSISLVVNLKEEYQLTIKYWKPFEASEDLDLNILSKKPVLTKKMKESFDSLVDKRALTLTSSKYKGNAKSWSQDYKGYDMHWNANLGWHQQETLFNESETLLDKYVEMLEDTANEHWSNNLKYLDFNRAVLLLSKQAFKEDVVITTVPKNVYDRMDLTGGMINADEYVSVNYDKQLTTDNGFPI